MLQLDLASCNTPFDLCLCLSLCFLNPHNSNRNTRIKLHVHYINTSGESVIKLDRVGRKMGTFFF